MTAAFNGTQIRSTCAAFVLACFALQLNGSRAIAQSDAGVRFFESKIRPVLVKHCYECHSSETGKAKGGLKVDSHEALLRGGDTGPAIAPKNLTKSLLYQAMLYSDDGYQMPPKGKLAESTIADFRKWILMGAPDPRKTKITPDVSTEIDIEKGREYWAYRPVRKPVIPPETDWARTDIDRFVEKGLKNNKFVPVEDADPRVLVRRLFFVISGLPPNSDDMASWEPRISADANAVEELIDELLASSQFGERWGRHWMDVARYAESTGGDQNNIYQHAWRYRDYVIDAFNDDKPFDQFIREQLAGDLLPIEDDKVWANNVIATGFLAIGQKLVGEEDQQKFAADLVDEQIDATTRAFLATTVACARCHDHKFDPIPQADYYALAGIFRSTETHYGLLKAQARQATTLLDLTGLGPPPGTPTLSEDEYKRLIAKRDAAAKAVSDAMAKIRSGENVFRGALRRLRSRRDETEAALQAYSARGEPRVFAMGAQDREFAMSTRLLVRGELDKPAQRVPAGLPQVLCESNKNTLKHRSASSEVRRAFKEAELGSASYGTSGRLHLAQWIASTENPLTARVIVNRIWYWMFGQGIVRTVDDFGVSGDKPTHPELLDHLATQFVENGWSVKKLIREIALSRTWQLSSAHHTDNHAIDPDNNFLWRFSKRRLEGEAIRDAMLAVSGELDLERPVGTYLREVGEGNVGQNVFEPVLRKITANTRSVYLPRVRNVLPEMLEVFDAPDAGSVMGTRNATSSPIQSLYLLNNAFVQKQAIALAARAKKQAGANPVDWLYREVYGRKPTNVERELGTIYLAESGTKTQAGDRRSTNRFGRGSGSARFGGRGRGRFSRGTDDSSNTERPTLSMNALAAYCQALLCTAEFQTID